MSHSPLVIHQLHKKYQQLEALKGASFSLEAGEMFGLIGLNGAGKTTLIKIVLDLIQANAGTATLYGLSSQKPQARQHLSYLPEKFQPSRYLKGYEYIDLSLSYYGKKLNRAAADEMAQKLGLSVPALSQRIGTYSKGMGQKLGLMTAFLVDTPLLILDEPMSGLDPQARIMLKEVMLETKRAGKTIFFSSHILADIDEICDRVAIIHHGEQVFLGTPQHMKAGTGEQLLERAFLKQIQAPVAAAA